MNTDRNVRLDVSVSDLRERSLDRWQARERPREEPDEQARERFEQAFSGDEAAAGEQPPDESMAAPVRPFDLFGASRAHGAAPAGEAAAATLAQAIGRIDHLVSRLMVGEDEGGGKQVRMELDEAVLPGVTVVVHQREGRLQVDFTCSQEAARLRLAAAIPREAPGMARRLHRDVLMRVQADDAANPRLLEVLGTAEA